MLPVGSGDQTQVVKSMNKCLKPAVMAHIFIPSLSQAGVGLALPARPSSSLQIVFTWCWGSTEECIYNRETFCCSLCPLKILLCETLSTCGCPGTCCVDQTGLDFTETHLPLPPNCWDQRCNPSHLACPPTFKKERTLFIFFQTRSHTIWFRLASCLCILPQPFYHCFYLYLNT